MIIRIIPKKGKPMNIRMIRIGTNEIEATKEETNFIEKMGKANITPKGIKTLLEAECIYLSHPYGGKEKNIHKAGEYAKTLIQISRIMKREAITILSPIHNFTWLSYHAKETAEYEKDIKSCLVLLKRTDTLVLCGPWEQSFGCRLEYLYALKLNLPIYKINIV